MEGDGLSTAELEKRLSLTAQGEVRSELKTPSRDGTAQVIFEPLDLIACLAAMVLSRGVNLTRYYGRHHRFIDPI